MGSEPIKVDLRSIVGTLKGEYPIKVQCPCHNDPAASLAVYSDHAYCYGKRRYFRRYESAALLLGLWNGNPATALEAVAQVRPLLSTISIEDLRPKVAPVVKPIDAYMADTFHRYLLSSSETLSFFKQWRGLEERTIAEFNLGYTGTHFTIPVYSGTGQLCAIRYRNDPRVLPDGEGSKYSGITGRNERRLYSVRHLAGVERSGSCWIFEGEFDSQVGWQLGLPSVTTTNGAGVLAELPGKLRELGLNPSRWIIATDQDEAGEQAAYELQQQLGSSAVRARWDQSYKDLSAFNLAGGTKQDIRLT